MSMSTDDRSEIGRDSLDAQVAGVPLQPPRFTDVFRRTRAALGLKPLTAPALVFVPLGAAIGPAGAGWIGSTSLGPLYGVTAVALAALGIFVGFGLRLDRHADRRLLRFASFEALITISVVTVGCAVLLSQWNVRLDANLILLALILGLCASATSAGEVAAGDPPTLRTAMRIADLDDALPILIGGIVLAIGTAQTLSLGLTLAVLNIAAPLAVSLAGWLLFERTHDEGERTVFVVGVVALLGGGAAYLGVSPLLAGMVAGLFWKYAPGRADTIIAEDLRRLQHPLVVLLLIVAGASVQPSLLALWMAGVYVITRVNGKLLGGWMVSRAIPALSPTDLGSYLLAPGVIGLSFALAFHMASPSAASAAVVTAVAAGTLASELLAAAALLGPRDA
jgi:hypothetical protein